MKLPRYLALSVFSILIWIAAAWYAAVDIARLLPNDSTAGAYYLPYVAFGLGLFCLFVNVRLFQRAQDLAERRPTKAASITAGLLGYILLFVSAATAVCGLLSLLQLINPTVSLAT